MSETFGLEIYASNKLAYAGRAQKLITVSYTHLSIYKKGGKTRKVHSLILLPGFNEADAFAAKMCIRDSNKCVDYLIRFLSFIGNSMPNFFAAMVLMYFLSIRLGVLPVVTNTDLGQSIILPTLTLAISMAAKYRCV